jgi:hypothetical protein
MRLPGSRAIANVVLDHDRNRRTRDYLTNEYQSKAAKMPAPRNKNQIAQKVAPGGRSNGAQICAPAGRNKDDLSRAHRDQSSDVQSRVSRCRDKIVLTLARKGNAGKDLHVSRPRRMSDRPTPLRPIPRRSNRTRSRPGHAVAAGGGNELLGLLSKHSM